MQEETLQELRHIASNHLVQMAILPCQKFAIYCCRVRKIVMEMEFVTLCKWWDFWSAVVAKLYQRHVCDSAIATQARVREQFSF